MVIGWLDIKDNNSHYDMELLDSLHRKFSASPHCFTQSSLESVNDILFNRIQVGMGAMMPNVRDDIECASSMATLTLS